MFSMDLRCTAICQAKLQKLEVVLDLQISKRSQRKLSRDAKIEKGHVAQPRGLRPALPASMSGSLRSDPASRRFVTKASSLFSALTFAEQVPSSVCE